MPQISPSSAVVLADGAYKLRNRSVAALSQVGRIPELGGKGLFSDESIERFSGSSGFGLIKALSGFGYVAEGCEKYAGELFVVTRGTAGMHDFMTDGDCGCQRGPGGELVHAGFNQTWKSFRDELMSFVRGRNFSAIHCVGHSLGGALAFLNADHFSTIKAGKVYLYTFGSPRVGFRSFSEALTRRVGSENIFRVSHVADPVAMVPVFPFLHSPTVGNCYEIANGGGVFRFGAHMLNSYRDGIGDMDWVALSRQKDLTRLREIESEEKMLAALEDHIGPAMYSVKYFREIMRGIGWILGEIGLAGLVTVQLLTTCSITVADQLAELLWQGVRFSQQVGEMVSSVLRAIMRFVGKSADVVGDITISFLRWALRLLVDMLISLVKTSISATMR